MELEEEVSRDDNLKLRESDKDGCDQKAKNMCAGIDSNSRKAEVTSSVVAGKTREQASMAGGTEVVEGRVGKPKKPPKPKRKDGMKARDGRSNKDGEKSAVAAGNVTGSATMSNPSKARDGNPTKKGAQSTVVVEKRAETTGKARDGNSTKKVAQSTVVAEKGTEMAGKAKEGKVVKNVEESATTVRELPFGIRFSNYLHFKQNTVRPKATYSKKDKNKEESKMENDEFSSVCSYYFKLAIVTQCSQFHSGFVYYQ